VLIDDSGVVRYGMSFFTITSSVPGTLYATTCAVAVCVQQKARSREKGRIEIFVFIEI
jgi:hypothetical protein